MSAKKRVKPVVLCGGAGTRLWPLSTSENPKQFLKLTGDLTMLQATLARVCDPALFDQASVIANVRHRHLVAQTAANARAILEPVGKNSAPAIAVAALLADADDILLIMPADHHIGDEAAFRAAVEAGMKAVSLGRMVTFGIVPEYPATGYGYIKADSHDADGVRDVLEFVEKPDLETAEHFLSSGAYFWNAGIFLFKAGDMIEALAAYAPDILAGVRTVLSRTRLSEGHSEILLDDASFHDLRSDSIDYAVMEHAKNLVVLPVDMGWTDIGDFSALSDFVGDNYVKGPVSVSKSNHIYARSEGPELIIRGAENLIIVATGDKVLVASKSEVAQIKPHVNDVTDRGQALRLDPALVDSVSSWLFEQCLPHWMSVGWDDERGGFVEALDMDGRPLKNLDRRGRVAPRQVFSFARPLRLARTCGARIDEEGLRRLILNGLTFLDTTARTRSGTWAHVLSPCGKVCDARRSLYDHAFVALAASEAYAVTGEDLAKKLVRDAFDIIDRSFFDPANRGYIEVDLDGLMKKSNPHMHLLEASLSWYRVSNDPSALARADQIVRAFETKMFDYENSVILENFGEDWKIDNQPDQLWFEPGHCFEWAVLLSEYSALSGHCTRSWQDRLISRAEKSAIRTWADIVPDRVYLGESHAADKTTFRLWPQLERDLCSRSSCDACHCHLA